MKNYCRYGVVCLLGILTFFSSLCFASSANAKAAQQGSMSKMQMSSKDTDGYNLYLNEMKKLNADRQCANLAPQHVYSYKEYKQVY